MIRYAVRPMDYRTDFIKLLFIHWELSIRAKNYEVFLVMLVFFRDIFFFFEDLLAPRGINAN